LEDVEAQLKEEFALVPALARQYTDLQRELNIATESLNRFLATREVLQIEAAQKSIPWELISSPVVPRSPISPKVPRNLTLGAIAGIFLGAAAAFISERLDTAFHSPSELKAVTKLPLLGVIPFAKELHGTSAATELTNLMPSDYPLSLEDVENWEAQSGMITAQQSSYKTSPFFEAFRSFYANIRFLSSDAPIRSLVISSAAPAEGKSTTALHLAKAAAAMGQRVLLVDADLRCPQIHTRLGLSNLRGLSTALTSTLPLKQVIQRPDITPLGGSAPDRNLFVLPAGPIPPDPIKLLSSKKMQALMAQLQSQYDLIVYDLPPLIGFADSTLVATHTDGMVLVVGLGKTDRSALTQSLEALKISPVSVLGIVANGIRAHTTHAYGYYRYHRYYSQQPLSPLNKFVRFFQNGKGD
jgi:capsular exopolysaccharide synthesis family protein